MSTQLRPRRKPVTIRPRDSYVDDLAVRRAMRGEAPMPVLSTHEVRLAARLLTQQGVPASVIAERTGVVTRTVHRWRTADRNLGLGHSMNAVSFMRNRRQDTREN